MKEIKKVNRIFYNEVKKELIGVVVYKKANEQCENKYEL